MSYTAIIKLEGETDIKVCFNPEPKPAYTSSRDYPSALEYWESNHQIIPFYSKEEIEKVLKHIGNWDNVKEGIQIDCVEVREPYIFNDGNYQGICSLCSKTFIGHKRQFVCAVCCEPKAYFKDKSPPKETTVSEDYLDEYKHIGTGIIYKVVNYKAKVKLDNCWFDAIIYKNAKNETFVRKFSDFTTKFTKL